MLSAVPTFARTRSTATARITTAPIATCCQNGWTPVRMRPVVSTDRIAVPITVPKIVPVPPKIDAPPITTAAIAYSSSFIPAIGAAVDCAAITIRPATPARKPASV